MSSGNIMVDGIVNNAGINDESKVEHLAFDIMNTNLFGIINLTETILP
jgi:short-subunit dehydrogenase